VEPQDLCADVDCAGSPARCDGEVAYSGTAAECNPAIGECQEAPGEPPRDCAAESLVCVNGNCVGQDLCANVDCTQRPARCEGDVAQGATHSECDPSSGECLLAPGVPPRDCAAEGLVCRDGDCVAPADDGLVSCELVELPGDLFTVFRAPSIAGQVLTVPVQYSGGCEEHIFPGCFDDFLEGGDNLRVALRIGHDGNGDLCKATPTEELEFDLGPVIEAWSAIPDHGVSFSLTVTGFRGVLQYP
jgi:hypothetical protein